MFPENGQFPQSSLAARLRVTVSALPVPLPALWSCSAPDRTRPFVSRYLPLSWALSLVVPGDGFDTCWAFSVYSFVGHPQLV